MHRRRLPSSFALFAALLGGTAAAPTILAGQGAPAAPSPADVAFMSGMIGHHAQAVLMAGWAVSHDASPTLQTYCRKVVVSQRDEIHLMTRWLDEHHEPLPDSTLMYGRSMPGMGPMLMPGMLTAAELARLDSARGPDWDRLFLEDMIRHHQGAITMVQQLFNTPGGGKGLVFQFATDVSADQTAEIGRMRQMLMTLP
ncbi:MAG TPA: DUF305 domain-containing protein [Gemmatimonadales bacterium]|jgi:uncharacterized protein (DUF305 family)|nr:DUF305 domain-containing protein [Gemmatimonadales bacterium]